MVQVPGLAIEPPGIVPFVSVTVRVGDPERVTAAPSLPVVQVVVGVPVKRKLLLGLVGNVSDKLAPVNGLGDGLRTVIVNVLVVPAAKVIGEKALTTSSPSMVRFAVAGK